MGGGSVSNAENTSEILAQLRKVEDMSVQFRAEAYKLDLMIRSMTDRIVNGKNGVK